MSYLISKFKENPILESGFPKFLFRGQTHDWKSIPTTYGRLPNDKILLWQAQHIYRRARDICSGLFGYSISNEEGLAILQHYGLPSPSVDLTGNIEIALFFATNEVKKGETPTLFILDTELISEGLILSEHNFLVDKIESNGLNNRWLRQDGYGITMKNWRSKEDVRNFDIQNHKGNFLTQELIVNWEQLDLDYDKNYIYDKSKDLIPAKIQLSVRAFCSEMFGEDTHKHLVEKINDIH